MDAATDGDIIILDAGVSYGTVYMGRPTKYNDTEANNDESTPKYTTTLKNVTIVGAEGATIAGLVATSGYVYGDVYDYVLDKDYDSGSAYYHTLHMENIKFSNVAFTGKIDINTSDATSTYNGITFEDCTFTTGGTASASGSAIRYYNEANNGNVKNIVVKNCTFNNCYQGVYVHHVNGITITDNEFNTTGHNAIAIQGHDGNKVNLKDVVITNNTFNNIGDRIIRFNHIGADSNITIQYNTATNSGDEDGEVMKATSIEEGITTNIGSNNWSADAVYNEELKDKSYTVSTLAELQAALNNANNGATIYINADITGDVVATQKKDVKITIEGQNKSYKGMITVDGKSARYETAGLTIKDLNFTAGSANGDANIRLGTGKDGIRYTNNVTVKNCTFTTTDAKDVVAIKSYEGGDYNLNIIGCTVDNTMHSLAQLKNIEKGLLIKDCTINSVRGICFNNTYYAEIDNCKFDVQKYAVRFGEGNNADTYEETYSIKNSELKSQNVEDDATIVLRGTAANSTLTIENTPIEGDKQIENNATNAIVIIDGVPTVNSSAGLASVIAKNYTTINMTEGEYAITSAAQGKTLTLNGQGGGRQGDN